MEAAVEAARQGTFFSRNEFLIRRLHSLTGLIPVGAYMCIHLLTNASTLGGPEMFQKNVDLIHSLGPALPIVEWTFIFLPLIFHAVVGVVIIRSGNANLSSYYYVGNVRYTLQRVTAWIALLFIAYHVFHMHGWFHNAWWLENVANNELGGHQFDPHKASSTAAIALASPLKKLFYGIGVISCVYHLANGLWTMGITWGVWTTAAAQRRANWICGAFGIALTVVGLAALVGVTTTDVDKAEAYEKVRHEMNLEEQQRAEAEAKRLKSLSPAEREAEAKAQAEKEAKAAETKAH
ncbi:MAG: succinate dehydrogenase cytochrome b558 subunit [Planctomycetales bacterium]|nr:succinate dehydrogenase cytochrome b558 subunit [Planctomycetales bacterium]